MVVKSPARYTQFTTLSKGDSAAVSVVQHLGRDHLRVPVVMLVGDKVINPTGSQGPEFVPSSILSALGWNGRPVIPIHPGMVSANTPEVIDKMGFGTIYHSQVKNGSLGCEVYLDITRAKELKNGADSVVRNCQAGDMIEVSTGCFVTVRQETGVAPDGTPYEFIWESIVEPDHLAMGLDGATGACSVDSHGCGAPRMLIVDGKLQENKENRMPDPVDNKGKDKVKPLSAFAARLAKMVEWFRSNEDISDSDLRSKLSSALYSIEPGSPWVVDVFQSTSTVVYTCWIDNHEIWYQRTFNLDSATGDVSLNDDRQEVVRKDPATVYEVVQAQAQTQANVKINSGAAAVSSNSGVAPCSCKGEVKTMDHARKPQIDKLIASGDFKEAERSILENMNEKKFKMLAEMDAEDHYTVTDDKKKEEEDSKKVTAAPVTTPVAVTDPSVIQVPADVYEQMKAAASAYALEQKNKKDTKVAECMRLQGENPVWTKADLEGMELVAVDKIHRSLSAQAKLTNPGGVSSPSILARNPDSLTPNDPTKVDAMPSVSQRILEKSSSSTKTVRGSAEIAANQSTN